MNRCEGEGAGLVPGGRDQRLHRHEQQQQDEGTNHVGLEEFVPHLRILERERERGDQRSHDHKPQRSQEVRSSPFPPSASP